MPFDTTPTTAGTVADVRVGDRLDGVYVAARTAPASVSILRRLAGVLPGGSVRRTADGIRLSADEAWRVREAGLDGGFAWSAAATRFVANRRNAKIRQAGAHAALKSLQAMPAAAVAGLIAGSEGVGVLDAHQELNVAAMTMAGAPGLCVFDEQGAGKTVTLIFAFDLLAHRDEADRVIVVAPKSMVPEWPRDFERFRRGLYRTAIVAGNAREKQSALRSDADVIVTNYETAVSLEQEITAIVRARPGRTVLAVDESFFAKSPDAQRTRALRRIREWCGRAFVLCGTPAPNHPQDLVQQFNLVDFGGTFDGVEVPDDRAEAVPVVQRAIEERGLYVRHLKVDVLPDLPAKRFQRIMVPMEDWQGRAYGAALGDLILDLESSSDIEFARSIPTFLARRAALLQICSNPASVVKGYTALPAKLAAMDSILDRIVGTQREKVIVWSFYTASIDAIVARYAQYGTLRYDGQVPDVGARREAVRRFQEPGGPMVMVANPAAAGAGLTLHRARFAVYESLSNQAAHYLQSLDRIHRRGQEYEVEYLVLLCDGTIEVQEYERLVRKEVAAQKLLGDEAPAPLTRETFLADARAAAGLLQSARL